MFEILKAEMAGSQTGGQAQLATLKEAYVTDERYVRASWVNVWGMLFHELTAINVVLAYSTKILENIFGTDPNAGGFTAR